LAGSESEKKLGFGYQDTDSDPDTVKKIKIIQKNQKLKHY
jgi:hypothetical protein